MQTYNTSNGNIIIDTDADFVSVDLTGGWKSTLLLYMIAQDIVASGSNARIIPCITVRINCVNEPDYFRPNAIDIVEKQITWIKHVFPTVIFHDTISMKVDFWWINIEAGKLSLDVSEKTMFRHAYHLAYEWPRVELGTFIKAYNAYTSDKDITNFTSMQNPHTRDKPYEHSVWKEMGAGAVAEFFNKTAYSIRPFSNVTKTDLAQIAKELNILDKLDEVSYTCEQSTREIKEPCGECFNCEQLAKAKAEIL